MVRSFTTDPVSPDVVDGILDLARRGPSAGKTASLDFLVLEGDQTARYWDTTLDAEDRDGFPWPRLLDAPVLIVVYVEPDAYVRRYAEPDKAATGLGEDENAWHVPYWWVDAGAAAMTVLMAVEAAGLGALLFGLFEHEAAVATEFGVPDGRRAIGAIAIGHPAPDRPSVSAQRPRGTFDEVVHRGGW